MQTQFFSNLTKCLLILHLGLLFWISPVLAEDPPSDQPQQDIAEALSEKINEVKKALKSDTEAVKILEVKEEQTAEEIKEKQENLEQAKEQATQVIEEKEAVEKEVEIKEQAAVVAKQELEAVKKEAEITQDASVIRKAEQLETEAEEREKEVDLSKAKLAVVGAKAGLAQKTLAASEEEVKGLKEELEELKREKFAKRGWVDKASSVGIILLIGLVLFLLLELFIKLFQRVIIKKDVHRQSAIVLRLTTLSKLFHWLGVFVITAVVIYSSLENLGVDVRPLLAGAGIMGLAFGFGGQYLIRDLINGVFILVEGQYRINDVVKIGEHGGLVEDVNLMVT